MVAGRASSADVAGASSATFSGGFAKAGLLINQDGGARPSGALAYAGKLGDATIFASETVALDVVGATFIRDHIIRVTEHAFDDFATGGTDTAANRRLLGLD